MTTPAPTPAEQPVANAAHRAAGLAGAAALITGLTVLARLAGFGRTFVVARTVGDGALANIYNAANTIPNIVFELVAGGALAGLVVPLLAGAVAQGDKQRVGAIASALLTWVLTLMVPLAGLVALLAGPIAGLFDVPPDQQAVAARMLRVFAPQLPLYGIGIVLTGVLQAHHRFAWPVLAPLLSSVTVMAAYLSYAAVDGARSDLAGLSRTGELILSAGTTAGVVVLALCLLIPLSRLRLRWRPAYGFPGDEGRRALRLGWAGAVTVGSQQVMVVVVMALAVAGPLALYTYAQTVFLLPWAVLAVPLATAVYPRLAAAAEQGDEQTYATQLTTAARSITLLACLGAAALAALAGPAAVIVGAPGMAPGIVGFAPGLLGYALFALLSRALYARGATVAAAGATAAGWGVAAVAAVVLSALVSAQRQVAGLGAANAIGMSVLGVLLAVAVRRKAGPHALSGLPRTASVGIVAAVVSGLAGWAVVRGLAAALDRTPGIGVSLLQGMLGGVVVAAVFVAVVYPLARRDLRPLVSKVSGRFRT
ncbi:murein biosynthesis integral membrane protein MurJ [Symbioplanes lichenis]|uniref:murein biosynthesis integral membrane protein MurJ n=1 Tax=Symbioplanes lichenis TaxID=1629072 RepID=UPI002739A1CB|nr:lipid II flippase MurJ [Actinoplanes lichenis]